MNGLQRREHGELVVYVAYNANTRRYEPIAPDDGIPGEVILRMFWSDALGKFVTIPGRSRMKVVNEAGELRCVG